MEFWTKSQLKSLKSLEFVKVHSWLVIANETNVETIKTLANYYNMIIIMA